MKGKKIFVFLLLVLALVFVLSDSQVVSAEKKWPEGKISMLVPYKAGGSSDAMARGLAKYWEKYLGVPIIIDNRDGASSQVGTTIYSRMPADGNTVYIGCQVYFSANIVTQNAKYKAEDFEVINIQQEDLVEIVVMDNSPYKGNPKKLFEAIKANPGKLSCGYIAGGPQNIAASILQKSEGLNFKSVTYASGNALRTALLGGHIDFMIGNGLGDLSVVGKAYPIVILGAKKSKLFPDVPVYKEVFGKNFPHLSMSTFVAVHKALKTNYPERFDKLVDTYKKVMNDKEYKKFLNESKQELITQYIGPSASAKVMKDIEKLVNKYKDDLIVSN